MNCNLNHIELNEYRGEVMLTQDITYEQQLYSETFWRNLGVSYNAINELEET